MAKTGRKPKAEISEKDMLLIYVTDAVNEYYDNYLFNERIYAAKNVSHSEPDPGFQDIQDWVVKSLEEVHINVENIDDEDLKWAITTAQGKQISYLATKVNLMGVVNGLINISDLKTYYMKYVEALKKVACFATLNTNEPMNIETKDAIIMNLQKMLALKEHIEIESEVKA